MWGSDLCFSSPPPPQLRAGPVLLTLLFFPVRNSFILPSFPWFYIFFSAGQVLLSTLSWCSALTSVSKGVFLMHPWREMYSTSTYSSTILFPVITFEGTGTLLQYSCLENPMDLGGLQSMGSLRVRHDRAISLALSCIGEGNGNPLQCSCQGWGSLVGCHLWGHTDSDTTEAT